ncbi:hypothetical protein GIB67_008222 [Kingdonia uniflora]|uniref:Uncharacterized protein n=1 Tax=Kingdonia uniflora TaxID=39325 RepID=A0A7J7N4N6_9MAGN|nr:hypothetical protein GIB67_008222 [Kingdonia uniflora]
MKSKFSSKSGGPIHYHKPSTIWKGIPTGAALLKPHIGWLIGNGTQFDFWRDTWTTDISIMEYIDLPRHLWKNCTSKLSNFINPQGWYVPNDIRILLLALGIDIQQIQCNPNAQDAMIWKPDLQGAFTTKNAFDAFHRREDTA